MTADGTYRSSRVGDTVTVRRPHVEHGPVGVPADQADASYLRSAVRNIEHRADEVRRLWGSGVTAMVVRLLTDAADAIESPDTPQPATACRVCGGAADHEHDCSYCLKRPAVGMTEDDESICDECAEPAPTDTPLHLAMSTLTRTLDTAVSILGDDAKACEIDGEVDPDLMWETLAGGYVPLAERQQPSVSDAAEQIARDIETRMKRDDAQGSSEFSEGMWSGLNEAKHIARAALAAARAGEAEPPGCVACGRSDGVHDATRPWQVHTVVRAGEADHVCTVHCEQGQGHYPAPSQRGGEAVDRREVQRRIDLTLKSVARFADRTAKTPGERQSIIAALADAQDDVALLAARGDAAPTVTAALAALHQSEETTIRVPVFDEFDSPYQVVTRCRECQRSWPCKTAVALGMGASEKREATYHPGDGPAGCPASGPASRLPCVLLAGHEPPHRNHVGMTWTDPTEEDNDRG